MLPSSYAPCTPCQSNILILHLLRTVPLNSRRVTAPILRCVAAGLGLPTAASVEELRQMIDGKLLEQGREPRDVQVVIAPAETGTPERVLLQDSDGILLEEPLTPAAKEDHVRGRESIERDAHELLEEVESARPGSETTEVTAERDRLAADLQKHREELDTLHRTLESEREKSARIAEEKEIQIEKLKSELQEVKRRSKEVWRINCDQLLLHDEELAAKDAEIVELKSKLLSAVGTLPVEPSRPVCF